MLHSVVVQADEQQTSEVGHGGKYAIEHVDDFAIGSDLIAWMTRDLFLTHEYAKHQARGTSEIGTATFALSETQA